MLTEQEFRALAATVDRSQHWGPDDALGALNFLTPKTVQASITLVEQGRIVSCADRAAAHPTLTTAADRAGSWLAVNETVTFAQHGPAAMTHFDALGHFFYEGRGHAGTGPTVLHDDGVDRLDVTAAAAGIVGRGVLLDLPAMAGAEYLRPEKLIGLSEVEQWLRETGTEPRAGDLLFVRTGRPLAPPPAGPDQLPQLGGLDLDCARWVHDTRFALVVSDNGLDTATPTVHGVATPWHVLTLTRMGVPLVDLADLEELAAVCAESSRWNFLAVIGVLPLARATASAVNPIAIF